MEINRDNYELWLADLSEGSLDSKGEDLVFAFLEENPDIRAEYEDSLSFVLRDDSMPGFGRNSLKRDASLLREDQVEHLVIARQADDLNPEQAEEISELILSDKRFSEMDRIHRSIRLTPPSIKYPAKLALKYIPFRKTARRLARISLPAAASILLAMAGFLLFSRANSPNPGESQSLSVAAALQGSDYRGSASLELQALLVTMKPAIRNSVEPRLAALTAMADPEVQDAPLPVEREVIDVGQLNLIDDIDISGTSAEYLLADVEIPLSFPAEEAQGGLSPREFIAKNFRQIFLKEEEAGTENLRVYEIADAGVRGLNKIFGWDMVLETEVNEEGRLNQLKFTSQLVKFDHKSRNIDQ